MKNLSQDEKRRMKQQIATVAICIAIYFIFLRIDKIGSFVSYLWTISKPIIRGLSLAFILNILMSALERLFINRLGMKKPALVRTVSIVLTLIIFFATIIFMIASVVPKFIESMISLAGQLPGFIDAALDWLSKFDFLSDKVVVAREYFNNIDLLELGQKAAVFIFGDWANTVSGTLNALTVVVQSSLDSFLVLIFSIYGLASKEELQSNSRKFLYAVFPEKFSDAVNKFCKLLYANFYGFFTGQILEALILGVMCFIGMTILRMPYSLMISVFVGFTNMIPYFGATIGAIISAVLIVFTDPMKGFIFLIFIIVLQQFDGNYLYPRLVGSRMGVPSIWVLFSITIGGALAGIPGMLIFVPLIATIYVLLKNFANKKLKEKNIDIEEKRLAKVESLEEIEK